MKNNVKLNRVQESALKQAISFYLVNDKVSIHDEALSDNTTIWKVNWSALGSVSSNKAREIGDTLVKAANVTEFLNNMKIEFTYKEDEEIKKFLIDDDKDKVLDYKNKIVENMLTAICHKDETFFDIYR